MGVIIPSLFGSPFFPGREKTTRIKFPSCCLRILVVRILTFYLYAEFVFWAGAGRLRASPAGQVKGCAQGNAKV